MPELPEVETIRRGLAKTIVGKKIVDFEGRDVKVVQVEKEEIIGAKVTYIRRRAKIIIFDLAKNKGSSSSARDSGEKYLIFHLKMTGQLIWEHCQGETEFCLRNRKGGGHPDKAWLEKLPNKHTRAIFKFDDGSVLYFNDIRRFGWIRLANGPSSPQPHLPSSRPHLSSTHPHLSSPRRRGSTTVDSRFLGNDKTADIFSNLGVEPLSEGLTPQYLQKKAERFPNRKIKQFIMDQAVIAGIGNIYADEALFDAKIKPMRLTKNISNNEWDNLIRSINKVLNKAIKYGGSSAENFVDAFGQQGRAHEKLLIYRKNGQPCVNKCGGMVERTVIGGRGTHWCPRCQK